MAARIFAFAGAYALTAACGGNLLSDTTIDPKSPIAAEAAKVANARTAFPKFSDIPAAPTDVRAPRAFGLAAADTVRSRDDIVRATEPSTWTLQGGDSTNAFATQARTAAGPQIAPADPAVTEAFARELRKRATPPPPPKR